jgi:uncharacterized protein involved in exopolysaccharide biosynthesis
MKIVTRVTPRDIDQRFAQTPFPVSRSGSMNSSAPGSMEVPDGEVAGAADGILTPARHWRNLFPDPKDLWIVFRRNLRPFLVVFLLVIGAVAAWTLTRTPVYSAMSSLLVLPQADQVVKVDAVTPDLPATTDIVNTEVRLMQSSSLALRVAERYAAQHPDAEIVRSKSREELADVIAAWSTSLARPRHM